MLQDELKKLENKTIIIYSAGNYGKYIFNLLKKYNITVTAFIDQNADNIENFLNLPVYHYSINDVCLDFLKEDAIVIVALVKPFLEREAVFKKLQDHGFKNIIDAQSLRCHIVYHDRPISFSENLNEYTELFNDEDSKSIYTSFVRSHHLFDFSDCIESKDSIQYFPYDIHFNKGYSRFIDCGGYTGDTVWELMKNKSGIDAIAIFEPEIKVFNQLQSNMDWFINIIPDIFLYPCAVSDKVEMMNMNFESGSSFLTDKPTEEQVLCVSIDSVLKNFAPTFIKMDIEGAEIKALQGAQETIKQYKPDLAICVYHCINHIWDIPLMLKKWVPSYKFYLRAHNSYTMETVLYATTEEK